jgi:hypothetical protein
MEVMKVSSPPLANVTNPSIRSKMVMRPRPSLVCPIHACRRELFRWPMRVLEMIKSSSNKSNRLTGRGGGGDAPRTNRLEEVLVLSRLSLGDGRGMEWEDDSTGLQLPHDTCRLNIVKSTILSWYGRWSSTEHLLFVSWATISNRFDSC